MVQLMEWKLEVLLTVMEKLLNESVTGHQKTNLPPQETHKLSKQNVYRWGSCS